MVWVWWCTSGRCRSTSTRCSRDRSCSTSSRWRPGSKSGRGDPAISSAKRGGREGGENLPTVWEISLRIREKADCFLMDTRQKNRIACLSGVLQKEKSFSRKCDHLSCRQSGKGRVVLCWSTATSDSYLQIKVHDNERLPDSPKLWNRPIRIAADSHVTVSSNMIWQWRDCRKYFID